MARVKEAKEGGVWMEMDGWDDWGWRGRRWWRDVKENKWGGEGRAGREGGKRSWRCEAAGSKKKPARWTREVSGRSFIWHGWLVCPLALSVSMQSSVSQDDPHPSHLALPSFLLSSSSLLIPSTSLTGLLPLSASFTLKGTRGRECGQVMSSPSTCVVTHWRKGVMFVITLWKTGGFYCFCNLCSVCVMTHCKWVHVVWCHPCSCYPELKSVVMIEVE